jgi:hypothetical protein
MVEQKSMLPQYPNEMPKPHPDRRSPAVWVREIGIFKTLEEGNEVRRIKLRPGLNILWAKPEDESGPVRLYEPGLSGHASGKTTFCRMLRHILGERHFANELVTRGVREKIDGGWVLGEVFINDNLWLVGRPFTLGSHPFCVRGATIDDYLRDKPSPQSFQFYIEELEKATVNPLSVKTLPKSGERAQWFHLLQWLARDQECRFIQITDWRSKLSRSDSPEIAVDDQHSLMRAVIGVLSEEERGEIERNAKLNKEKEAVTAEVPILRRQAQTDHQRLENSFGRPLPTPDDPLLVESVKTELTESLNKTESDISEIDNSGELLRLQESHETAIKKSTEVSTELRLLDQRIGELNTKLQMHQRGKTERSARDFAARIPPGVGYCRVPIEESREKGCTLAFDQPRDLASEGVLRSIEDLGAEIQKEVEALSQRKSFLNEQLRQCRQQEQIVNGQLMRQRTNLAKKRHELYNQRSELLDRIKLAQRAHEAWVQAGKLARRIEDLEAAIDASRKSQEKYRERTKKAVSELSLFYQEIVRAVLGNSVSGGIQLSGRDFACRIERNGDVSSGAIDTIKILAFDLAALAASVSGQGNHPRFLLHDSPREADMAPLTYKRIFLWARQLEEAFKDRPCNFQYIITTTEAPPAELQAEPWLLYPVLDASQPEKRLLGVDL